MYKKKPLFISWSANQGMTLIELIVTIVVVGIIIVGLASALMNIVSQSTKPEDIVKANYLGQQKIEELTKNSFSNISIINQAYTPTGIAGFQWSWIVEYINGTTFAYSATPTNYKRITVKVKDPGNSELSYYTIATKRYQDSPQG